MEHLKTRAYLGKADVMRCFYLLDVVSDAILARKPPEAILCPLSIISWVETLQDR